MPVVVYSQSDRAANWRMLMDVVYLGFLILMTQTSDVTSQTITLDQFNNSLTRSNCSDPYMVLEGERIVLTATLDISNSNRSDWPLDQIFLQGTYPVNVNICQINIERDGCRGFRPNLCGYCDQQENELYYLVFNFTTFIGQNSSQFRCMWVGASSLIKYSTYSINVGIMDQIYSVYLTTLLTQETRYSVLDIQSDTFTVNYETMYLKTTVQNGIYDSLSTWRYGSDTDDPTPINYNGIDYNITTWDEHIDDVINLYYNDSCGRNWPFTIPVTDRPSAVCDLTVTSRSNSTGTQVKTTCKLSTPWIMPQIYCNSGFYASVSTSIEGDLATCTLNISGYFLPPAFLRYLRIRFEFLLDTQFTNNTKQLPSVVRFNVNESKDSKSVNSSRSATLEPGANITFECKVYGNPSAKSVLVGPEASRIQEYSSNTDIIHYTLTGVKCQDSGRYTCKGVSGFGTTPTERQAHVDVNIRCPTAIKSHVPSNKDRKFNFDLDSDILITLEVYGYPAPTQFGLQVQQGSAHVNVSRDRYTTKYVDLDLSHGLVSLLMSRDKTEGPQSYVFSISNGYNISIDFQFQLGGAEEESESPWLYAFIAVICIVGVTIVVIIIIYVVKKRINKRQEESHVDHHLPVIGLPQTSAPIKHTVTESSLQRGPEYDHPETNTDHATPLDEDQDDVYENVEPDNIYELP